MCKTLEEYEKVKLTDDDLLENHGDILTSGRVPAAWSEKMQLQSHVQLLLPLWKQTTEEKPFCNPRLEP
jgi:hypothetical protein